MKNKSTNKSLRTIILIIAIILVIFILIVPQIKEKNRTTNDSSGGLEDLTTAPIGLTTEECTNMGGKIVNTAEGETCDQYETLIEDVTDSISLNICCLAEEAITKIDNFEKCADAGFPIIKSYPMECSLPNGKIFTKETTMNEKIARSIAETSKECTDKGTIKEFETYNAGTSTWWFALESNELKSGCNPACVVSEETELAEVNWRCTGLITK